MIANFVAFLVIVAVGSAIPVWFGNPYPSGVFLRNAQPPSIAFGFGSGFSSDIGGIKHSSSYGNSFQTGNAQAYGAGFGSADGNTFARGIGYAQTAPQQNSNQFQFQQPYQYHQFRHPVPQLQQATAATFSSGGRSFGSASAQSFGNFGSAISSAQSIDGIGSAVSAVQNNGEIQSAISSTQGRGYGTTIATSNGYGHAPVISRADNFGGHQTAFSSTQGTNGQGNYGTSIATSSNGHGLRPAISRADNLGGQQTAFSSTQGPGGQGNYGTSIVTSTGHGLGPAISRADNFGPYQSAFSSTQAPNGGATQGAIAQNVGGYRTSNAYNAQQGSVQNSVAINGPGIQVAQTYSNNNEVY